LSGGVLSGGVLTSRVQENRALNEEAGGVNARAAWLAW
jgi:hypothetical protein